MTTINTARANLLAFITSPTSPQAAAIRFMLEAEGFTTPRLREILTDVEVETAAVSAVDVRAAIDAAVLAALDGINLREAIASLVEERVTNADLDIEEMAKEVISDKADDLDMEDLARSLISDFAGDIDMEDLAKEVISGKADDLDIEEMAKEVISDLTGELDMECLAKRVLEDSVDYADVVREVVDAEFTRSDIKHEIREAITDRITERLSNVQVSVTV